ncbi:MAG: amidohydrolase family protein [Woeseia sp.]
MKPNTLASVLLILGGLAPAVSVAQEDPPANATVDLAIVGGQLIDGYGGLPVQNAVILVSKNRIVEVGQVGMVNIPSTAEVIDSNGMTVLPGLWESHGHLFHVAEGDPESFPTAFRSRAPEVMAAVAKISLMSGITTFRDTGGPAEPQLALKKEIESGAAVGPRLFIAGPILRQSAPGKAAGDNEYPIDSVASARRATLKVIALGVDQVKVYGFWDKEVLEGVTSTAHEAGLGVDADVRHINAYKTAIEAGVDRLHHVFTADALSDYSDEDIRLMVRGVRPTATGPSANILRGPYIVPTIEVRNAYVRMSSFPEILDHPKFAEQYPADIDEHLRRSWENPSSVAWGVGAPERIKAAKRKLKQFIEAGGREQLVAGTDAGAPFNFHSPLTKEMQNLHEAGLTPMETIQSATLRPAQMQGVERELGTVTKGKFADMIIVDGDPLQDITLLQHKIVMVIKDGKLYPVDRSAVRE